MDIAQRKRKENIGEYILYLWQLEDLLRAMQLSPEAIYSQLVKPRQIDELAKQELFVWYVEVADLMRKEGKEEVGHLDHTLHLIADLENLHQQLMKLAEGEHYRELYAALAPELPRLKTAIGRPEMSDIEISFRALYSVVLHRIKGTAAASKYVEDVLEVVSPVVAELAMIYGKVERGEVDLFKE